ncbi:MAG: hypothetical protein LBB76_08505 [Azoarcus sp.]|jgi:hypothetical protein|nr:hypothetical protein [Azoarcus sp.]
MLEPVSVSAFALSCPRGSPALVEYAQSSSAVSEEANRLSDMARRVMRERQDSQSLFGAKANSLSELSSVIADLHVDEDQAPVSPETFRKAWQFILALPDDLPNPTFGIDPDGEISMTWHVARARIFSVSISASERIAYAWMDGSNNGHGVDRFRTPVLPAMLASALRTIVANDPITTLRVA